MGRCAHTSPIAWRIQRREYRRCAKGPLSSPSLDALWESEWLSQSYVRLKHDLLKRFVQGKFVCFD